MSKFILGLCLVCSSLAWATQDTWDQHFGKIIEQMHGDPVEFSYPSFWRLLADTEYFDEFHFAKLFTGVNTLQKKAEKIRVPDQRQKFTAYVNDMMRGLYKKKKDCAAIMKSRPDSGDILVLEEEHFEAARKRLRAENENERVPYTPPKKTED